MPENKYYNDKRTAKSRVRWIAQTGIFLALLVVAQLVTRPFGNSILTGSVNNMLFVLAVMFCGLSSAAVLGVISPIIAFLMGMAPFLPFVPVIIVGNLALVALWYLIALRKGSGSLPLNIAALVISAVVKFLILYFGIVRFVVPLVLGLAEPQASVVSAAFSWPQLVTATIGGVLALLLFRALSKALPKR